MGSSLFLSLSLSLSPLRLLLEIEIDFLRCLRTQKYTIVFCTCDVISLVVQAIGGGSAAVAVQSDSIPRKDPNVGARIMVGGIIFQMAIMVLFTILGAECEHSGSFLLSRSTRPSPICALFFFPSPLPMVIQKARETSSFSHFVPWGRREVGRGSLRERTRPIQRGQEDQTPHPWTISQYSLHLHQVSLVYIPSLKLSSTPLLISSRRFFRSIYRTIELLGEYLLRSVRRATVTDFFHLQIIFFRRLDRAYHL